MANRNFASGGKLFSMHVMPVMVDCQITIGASGAVSSFVGPLIDDVQKVATGVYEISLSDNFNRLFFAAGSAQSPSVGLSGISTIEIGNSPSADVSDLSAPSLTIKCLDAAGAAANPASGSVINAMMILSNSSVVIQGE